MMNRQSFFVITILCLQTLYNCIVSIIGQYIYGYFLQTYPGGSSNGTNGSYLSIPYDLADSRQLHQEQCAANKTDLTNNSAQDWAQQHSADLLFRITLWRAFPVIVSTYLFGVYSSRLNRRWVLLVSIFGNAMHVVIYQGIIYEHLAEYWWYVSAFIAGLAGGTNVIGIVINLIITESTDEHGRSTQFVHLGAITTALSAIATFGIGYYIQWRGFTDLLWMSIAVEVLSMLAVIFLLQTTPSQTSVDETSSLLSTPNSGVEIRKPPTFQCAQCFDICATLSFKDRSRKRSISLILTLIAYVFNLLALSSLAPLLWYLLGTPFCWTSKDLGNFGAISLISTAILSVLGMRLLTRCGANDALICAFGHLCFIGYALCMALAKYGWQLYLALLINPFSGYQSTLTVPMISKWLEVHERSHLYTLVTEINTIILAFGSSLFNWVYARTVTRQKNFTVLFASGVSIVPLILNVVLFFVTRRMTDEQNSASASVIDVEPTPMPVSTHLSPQLDDVPHIVVPSRARTDSHSSHDGQSFSSNHHLVL